MVWLCSLSSLCLRDQHDFYCWAPSLVIKSHMGHITDPLPCPLKICTSSQLSGLWCRDLNASQPCLLPSTSSSSPASSSLLSRQAPAPAPAQGTGRHQRFALEMARLYSHLIKDTIKEVRKSSRAESTSLQNKMTEGYLCEQGDKMHFQMAFCIILFNLSDVYLSELFLLQYSAHLVISSWCMDSKHILATLLMK